MEVSKESHETEAEWHAEGRLRIDARIIHGALNGWFKTGAGEAEWFKDHKDGPEMVVVPAGGFLMGSPESESGRWDNEGPVHPVAFARPVCVGRHAVKRGQFAAFVSATSYTMEGGAQAWTGTEWKPDQNLSWRDPGFRQDDSHPVVCVNWNDACAYVAWLSEVTGQTYRLLTEAEREYVARAGTATPFWWGSSITPANANYDGFKGGRFEGQWRKSTVPAGHFEANPWGLYNVHGNVWEWCQDTWHYNYNGAPSDGSAWLDGGDVSRVIRGGSWCFFHQFLRSAYRNRYSPDDRNHYLGFRVARTLPA